MGRKANFVEKVVEKMGRDHSNDEENPPTGDSIKAGLKGPAAPPSEDTGEVQSRQRVIGKELRRWYDNIVKEPVPDDLLKILKEIDNRSEGES